MRWVTPNLMVGTSDDAAALDYEYTDRPERAAELLRPDDRRGAVVDSVGTAADVLRRLNAPTEWITFHLLQEWARDSEVTS